jgi:hypothetical protein
MRLALWLVLLSVIAAGCLGGSNAASSGSTPTTKAAVPVLTGEPDRIQPAASGRTLAWSQWSKEHGYSEYVRVTARSPESASPPASTDTTTRFRRAGGSTSTTLRRPPIRHHPRHGTPPGGSGLRTLVRRSRAASSCSAAGCRPGSNAPRRCISATGPVGSSRSSHRLRPSPRAR